jgi:lipid A 4'-phosphatase
VPFSGTKLCPTGTELQAVRKKTKASAIHFKASFGSSISTNQVGWTRPRYYPSKEFTDNGFMSTPSAPATTTASSVFNQRTPASFYVVLAVSFLLALVPTLWTQLDIAFASLFFGDARGNVVESWWWIELINAYVPAAFRVMLLLAIAGWTTATVAPRWAAWRLPLAFVIVAGFFGPGLVVNAVFKDNWQRARPYQVENFGGTQQFTRAAVITDQCDSNCSFVSGHVACGFFFSSLLLLFRRHTKTWLVIGTLAGLTVGLARAAAMAHWLSDILWAYPITLVSSWLVWLTLQRGYRWWDARAGRSSFN